MQSLKKISEKIKISNIALKLKNKKQKSKTFLSLHAWTNIPWNEPAYEIPEVKKIKIDQRIRWKKDVKKSWKKMDNKWDQWTLH